jgi:hypothetical protein
MAASVLSRRCQTHQLHPSCGDRVRGWDVEFESGLLQQRVCELSVPERRGHFPARTP